MTATELIEFTAGRGVAESVTVAEGSFVTPIPRFDWHVGKVVLSYVDSGPVSDHNV